MSERAVIVGAGQAGLQSAVSLRQGGFEGDIILLGAEAHLPYQRPPLSKQVLKGEWPPERCTLRQPDFIDGLDIDFRPDSQVTALDCAANQLSMGERVLDYDHLVIATGAALNRMQLDGSHLDGIHYLRTVDDAMALKARLVEGARLVVAGGGYIGLEVAASARSLGCTVDVVEAQDHIMKRSALPPVADFLLERHRSEGVTVHLGRMMTTIHGGASVTAVSLDDGRLLDADVVLKGIGVRPEIEWLEGSGVDTGRGVLVDAYGRTNVANIYAAGDVAETQHPSYTNPVVLESVQNAVSQGKIAAAAILGLDQAYEEVPWFWSEQYNCRFQMAGLAGETDELVIRDTGPHSLSVLSLGEDRLNAIQCIYVPKDYMAARKLIAAGNAVDLDKLRDPAIELKELL